MSYTTVSVSRRVVMLKVRPKPGSRKPRSPPPNQDPIFQNRTVKETERAGALLNVEFSKTPKKGISETPPLFAALRNRSKIVVVAIAVVVMIVGVVLFLRWVIHPESGLPETRQDVVVTQPQMFNIRPRVSSIRHTSITPQGRSVALPVSAPSVPDDQIEMAGRKWVLPSDVSGACSIGSGVVGDLVSCLDRYGAQAR